MKNTLPQAIALCRVSTKGQLLDGNLEPQEERIIRAAAMLNVDVVRWWKLAVSSRKGKNLERKDIIEMFEFCKSNKSVQYLIVDEVDRFMRSISEYYYWKVRFQNINVQLRHANRPDADPAEDRAVFDELIDIYRAESSNNERITKTPVKMMEKIRLGFYPSNPHTGYKTTDIAGLHEPDEPNWSAMRDTFKEMISGELTVAEGLKKVTERGLRTRNYGPKSVGGKTIDMFRWKELMTDPYYFGVVKMKDWPVINEDGQHVKMITKEDHIRLVELAHNKGKRFIVDRNNPTFLMSNEINCFECLELNKLHPRLVGYKHNNGRDGKLLKFYNRYRCRECSRNIRQETLHSEIDIALAPYKLTDTELRDLKLRLKKLWRNYEKVLIQQSIQAERDLQRLKAKKGELVEGDSSIKFYIGVEYFFKGVFLYKGYAINKPKGSIRLVEPYLLKNNKGKLDPAETWTLDYFTKHIDKIVDFTEFDDAQRAKDKVSRGKPSKGIISNKFKQPSHVELLMYLKFSRNKYVHTQKRLPEFRGLTDALLEMLNHIAIEVADKDLKSLADLSVISV